MLSQYDKRRPELRAAEAQLVRVAAFASPAVTITLDGVALPARLGETVLAAVLTHTGHVRLHEADGTKRAGFCLMGACQDCWMWFTPTEQGRACTTLVADGMRISTQLPPLA
jgi:predicted molibdopterin-dependent oxidoreductase YjgC